MRKPRAKRLHQLLRSKRGGKHKDKRPRKLKHQQQKENDNVRIR